MKFLCDQMLIRLGRWLRAAGYDTGIVEQNKKDKEILNLALQEERLLITRDRHFLEMKESKGKVIWLSSNHLEDCVKELTSKVPINWLLAPFSRCMVCNHYLEAAPSDAQAPPNIKEGGYQLWLCTKCGKIYWQGSHTKRMLDSLVKWEKIKLED